MKLTKKQFVQTISEIQDLALEYQFLVGRKINLAYRYASALMARDRDEVIRNSSEMVNVLRDQCINCSKLADLEEMISKHVEAGGPICESDYNLELTNIDTKEGVVN